jgi:hypothetical protein
MLSVYDWVGKTYVGWVYSKGPTWYGCWGHEFPHIQWIRLGDSHHLRATQVGPVLMTLFELPSGYLR